jgi:hypothetical protein
MEPVSVEMLSLLSQPRARAALSSPNSTPSPSPSPSIGSLPDILDLEPDSSALTSQDSAQVMGISTATPTQSVASSVLSSSHHTHTILTAISASAAPSESGARGNFVSSLNANTRRLLRPGTSSSSSSSWNTSQSSTPAPTPQVTPMTDQSSVAASKSTANDTARAFFQAPVPVASFDSATQKDKLHQGMQVVSQLRRDSVPTAISIDTAAAVSSTAPSAFFSEIQDPLTPAELASILFSTRDPITLTRRPKMSVDAVIAAVHRCPRNRINESICWFVGPTLFGIVCDRDRATDSMYVYQATSPPGRPAPILHFGASVISSLTCT